MLYNLPQELLNKVLQFAGTDTYWKRRFTNDVLAKIDRGIVFVGVHFSRGLTEPCVDCYNRRCCNYHLDWQFVSYSDMGQMKPRSIFMVRGLSLQAYRWMVEHRRVVQLHKIKAAIKKGVLKTQC